LAAAEQVLLQTQAQVRLLAVITQFLIPHLLAHLQAVLLHWVAVVVVQQVHQVQVALVALAVVVEKIMLVVLLALQIKATQGAVAIELALITHLVVVGVRGLLVLDALQVVFLVTAAQALRPLFQEQ
jgi:hypothetical protein